MSIPIKNSTNNHTRSGTTLLLVLIVMTVLTLWCAHSYRSHSLLADIARKRLVSIQVDQALEGLLLYGNKYYQAHNNLQNSFLEFDAWPLGNGSGNSYCTASIDIKKSDQQDNQKQGDNSMIFITARLIFETSDRVSYQRSREYLV